MADGSITLEQLMKERAAQQAAEQAATGGIAEYTPQDAEKLRERLPGDISSAQASLTELEKKGLPTLGELAKQREAEYLKGLGELNKYFPPVQRPPLQPESTLPVSAPRYTDVVGDRARAYGAIARDSIVSALQGAGIQSGQPVGALTQMIAQAAIQGALGGARKSVGFTSEQLATTPTQESLPILRAKEQAKFAKEAQAYQRRIQEEDYQAQKQYRAQQVQPRAGYTEEQLSAASTRERDVDADTKYDTQTKAQQELIDRLRRKYQALPLLRETMQ